MIMTASRIASSAPSIETIQLAVETASISDIVSCATAGLDEIIGDWSRFAHVDASVETETYATIGEIASLDFELILTPSSGLPTLVTVTVTAGFVRGALVLLSVEPARPAPDCSSNDPIVQMQSRSHRPGREIPIAIATIAIQDDAGRLSWPTPLSNVLATGLSHVMSLVEEGHDDVVATLEGIREIARKALAFDRERMRLRFDDQHGNRSFVQFVDGRWKAFRNDGHEVRFSYCFGSGVDEASVEQALSLARTVHSIQSAALSHTKGLQDVHVEMVWERHLWNGSHFAQVPVPSES